MTPFAKGRLCRGLKWNRTGHMTQDILDGQLLNEQKYTAAMQLYLEIIRVKDLSKLNI